MAFIWGHHHKKIWRYQSVKQDWITLISPRGQWVNDCWWLHRVHSKKYAHGLGFVMFLSWFVIGQFYPYPYRLLRGTGDNHKCQCNDPHFLHEWMIQISMILQRLFHLNKILTNFQEIQMVFAMIFKRSKSLKKIKNNGKPVVSHNICIWLCFV